MMSDSEVPISRLRENYRRVLDRVQEAAEKSGRDRNTIRLIGVTKYVDSAMAQHLAELGCLDLAESRPQELWRKRAEVKTPGVRWHMIGHLQRNKVRKTIDGLHLIHSVDSLRLLDQIDSDARALGIVCQIMIEINVTPDHQKTGAVPAIAQELLETALVRSHVRVLGLMGMARLEGGSKVAREDFSVIREFRDRFRIDFGNSSILPELSMGMSSDLEVAVEEGSTMIRIGSALFEGT